MKKRLSLKINGQPYACEVEPNKLLLNLLRELGFTGAKYGCGIGECGACSVLIDGELRLACLTLALSCQDKEITTVEGLAELDSLHPLQEAFIETGAIQCGYCTPGMLVACKSLLDSNPSPAEEEVREYLRGNLCRCTGYSQIVEAVLRVSGKGS